MIHNQSVESKKMAKLTISKYFGEVVKMRYNRTFPQLFKINKFLIANKLQKRTIKSVLEQIGKKWDLIAIKKKTARAKNGDLIEFTDFKQLKKANLEKSIEKPKEMETIDKDIQVFRCNFVKMSYINTINGCGTLIVKLENGETMELLGNQRTINHLPVEDILKTKVPIDNSFDSPLLSDLTRDITPQLIIHYKNKWEWAIEPPQAIALIMDSIGKSVKN